MKTLKKLILIFVLFFVYSYIVSIDNIPENIIIFKGEDINIATLWGINIKSNTTLIETASNINTGEFDKAGQETLTVSLFDKINLKTIDVSVLEDIEVIPNGEIVGIKLYTSGVLVVGTSSIEGIDGQIYKPFEGTGILEGDSIIEVNGNIVNNTFELVKNISKSNGQEIEIKFVRNGEEKTCKITPAKNKQEEYKIGLWVRDSAGGVGTVTFYNEETKSFAALGHAITDIDTGEIINTSSGEIDDVNIVSIVKGEKEEPGKVQGTIINGSTIGNIYKNCGFGIYGTVENLNNLDINYNRRVKVASRQEIELGKATFLSGIDGQVKEYELEIEKIYLNNNEDNKSMLIKITDEELLEKTGGIIQGMSGSPIIQNGKFIGAITHVFVKEPQVGYAVFGDMMLNELE